MATIKGKEKEDLAKLYGDFLTKEYGSLDRAFATWNDQKLPLDNAAAGIADLRNLWEATQPRPKSGRAQRITDQVRFLTETMYNFNQMMDDYIHHDLGCKQLINPSNWKTADGILLNDAERYSYMPNQVMASSTATSAAGPPGAGVRMGHHQGR